MIDLLRERPAQKMKLVIQRSKRADKVRGGRGSPLRKTKLLLFMVYPSASHCFPPSSPSHHVLLPTAVLHPSPGQT